MVAVPVSIWLLKPSAAPKATTKPLAAQPAEASTALAEPEPLAEVAATPEPSQPAPVVQKEPEPEPATIAAVPQPAVEKSPEKPASISANTQIVELLRMNKVTGLLLSNDPGESKILLDGQVYSVNGIVDYRLGCRIAEIKKNAVVFTDKSGVRYTKRF